MKSRFIAIVGFAAFITLAIVAFAWTRMGYEKGVKSGHKAGYEEAIKLVADHIASGTFFTNFGPLIITNDCTFSNVMVVQVITPPSAIEIPGGAKVNLNAGTISVVQLK